MVRVRSRHLALTILAFIIIFSYYTLPRTTRLSHQYLQFPATPWSLRQPTYPVLQYQKLPRGRERKLPQIQHNFGNESEEQKKVRLARLQAIKDGFNHTWQGYRKYAWMADEVQPLSGGNTSAFGNWSATLVDSLDTLWIMDFKDEFREAVDAVATINFSQSDSGMLSVFETTIRYLGGLLSAYDLSGEKILLQKAVELSDLLYGAFDTPNRMPVDKYNWQGVLDGLEQTASFRSSLADIGSLSLEFTRLSQLTGNDKYFDAVQRISDLLYAQQLNTSIPGLWPTWAQPAEGNFTSDISFSLGTSADSAYEYMPKMNLLLGGQKPEYAEMYSRFIEPSKQYLFYRPMTKDSRSVLLSGYISAYLGDTTLIPSAQHLGCFIGGMVAVGAKTIGPASDIEVAERLADGCYWAYESTASGIMPETMAVAACISKDDCPWNEAMWHGAIAKQHSVVIGEPVAELIKDKNLPPGFTQIIDDRYLLRPEALESMFILYRVTGDVKWQEKAWKMWQAIEKAAKTDIAFAQLDGVSQPVPNQVDTMESFWPAETLKYLYLTFSDPGLISLDEWVLNTEAHPFRRPRAT